MGYTPAFDTIYDGTLYGRWPAAAVWASLLPLIDQQGRIDRSLQAIAGMTGWPLDLLTQGIQQLMEPDEHSRTPGHDGRRLVPIDPDRSWGWIAVNHGKYREKARLMSKDSERTASGRDAERKRAERASPSPDVPRCPPPSPAVPLSDTDTDTDLNPRGRGASAPTPPKKSGRPKHPTKVPIPDDFALTADLAAYVASRIPDADPPGLFESFRGKAEAKGWLYANWRQAFQEFVRNAAPNSGHFASGQYPRQGGARQWQ